MTLKKKLVSGFSILLLGVIVVSMLSWQIIKTNNETLDNIINFQMKSQENLLEIKAAISKINLVLEKAAHLKKSGEIENLKSQFDSEIKRIELYLDGLNHLEIDKRLINGKELFKENFAALKTIKEEQLKLEKEISSREKAYNSYLNRNLKDFEKIRKNIANSENQDIISSSNFRVINIKTLIADIAKTDSPVQLNKYSEELNQEMEALNSDYSLFKSTATASNVKSFDGIMKKMSRIQDDISKEKGFLESKKQHIEKSTMFSDIYNKNKTNEESMTKVLVDIMITNDKNTEELNLASKANAKENLTKIIITAAAVLVIGIFVTIGFVSTIQKSLSTFVSAIDEISNGKIYRRVNLKSKDEFGKLATSFDSFLDKLNNSLFSVKISSENIYKENKYLSFVMNELVNGVRNDISDDNEFDQGSIEEEKDGIIDLQENMNSLLDNVRNQTSATEEILAAMDQMNEFSRKISENSLQTLALSKNAVKTADEGHDKMLNLETGIMDISTSVDESSMQITKLTEFSNKIGDLITSINDIAEKTNLLALNAAIEAARAGDAGRGFSVVADEIRKLAEQTNGETEKIEKIIANIQDEVKTVRLGNQKITKNVANSLGITEDVKDKIKEIIEQTNTNTERIGNISNEINEQFISITETREAIGNITNNSSEIETNAINTSDISQYLAEVLISNLEKSKELAEIGVNLQNDVNYFKTNE